MIATRCYIHLKCFLDAIAIVIGWVANVFRFRRWLSHLPSLRACLLAVRRPSFMMNEWMKGGDSGTISGGLKMCIWIFCFIDHQHNLSCPQIWLSWLVLTQRIWLRLREEGISQLFFVIKLLHSPSTFEFNIQDKDILGGKTLRHMIIVASYILQEKNQLFTQKIFCIWFSYLYFFSAQVYLPQFRAVTYLSPRCVPLLLWASSSLRINEIFAGNLRLT